MAERLRIITDGGENPPPDLSKKEKANLFRAANEGKSRSKATTTRNKTDGLFRAKALKRKHR